jgi:glycosyltransferase involved in cell wall biosynthesis
MTPRPTSQAGQRVAILGIRGLPARHGGFESFAERLAPYLADAGWHVTVYCQEDGGGSRSVSQLGKVRCVHLPSGADTPVASMRFDWRCIDEVLSERPDVVLLLGYNTALFTLRLRAAGIPTVINMDGIEWGRAKWGLGAQAWLYLNERVGCLLGHHLIADHPVIERHLATRVRNAKITTIPYGGALVDHASASHLAPFGLKPGEYVSLIARPEPENSVLEVVRAFSARRRHHKLMVLGQYEISESSFHRQVLEAASDEVLFPGAIYDSAVVGALRKFSKLYVHGHQVGGTNPSLLDAMGAGNAVLAHDNPFNRWVAGDGALYFRDELSCQAAWDRLLSPDANLQAMGQANRQRVADVFDWQQVLSAYASLLLSVSRRRGGLGRKLVANRVWDGSVA